MTLRIPVFLVIASAALLSFPSLAMAQAPAQPGESTTASAPFTMPDVRSSHIVGVEASVARRSATGSEPLLLMNLDIHGQFEVTPGLFIVGRLPTSAISVEDTKEADLGNLSLGGRYVVEIGPGTVVGGSLGVALPTSPSSDLDSEDGLAAFVSGTLKFDQFGRYWSDLTTYSGHLELRFDGLGYFVQSQLGYERHVLEGEDEALDMLRLTIAGGYKASNNLALIGELTTLSLLLEDNADEEENFHWLRVGARYDTGAVTVGGHVYRPLDAPDYIDGESLWGVVFEISKSM